MLTFLDGAIGTELAARGLALPPPLWSAVAVRDAPSLLGELHAEYASAGASVHTACTFRTKRRQAGDAWVELTHRAVELARGAVPRDHRVAGSIAPLEDCYRPDLSPVDSRDEHRELAVELARAGVDLLLCETFTNVSEGLVALEEAVSTGLPSWLALSAGPDASLLTPSEVARAAREAVARGASAVLVNCTEARATARFLEGLEGLGVPFGAYANAGSPEEGLGWSPEADVDRYAELAASWVERGATIVGGCCGTSPRHIAAMRARLG